MTAWRRLSLTLLVALCCHTAASAEETTLTVYNETNTSSYIPVYGWGVDALGTTSEFVIPRGQLGAMEGGTISALTFYLSTSAADAWTATFQVYLKEISATTLTGITGPDDCTVVYTGTLNATGSEMTVTFSTPYTYNGGDLLIGTYVSVKSTNYPQASFYGFTQSANTACYKKSGSTTLQQFIPKTTFTYGVVPPNNLAVSDVTTTTATVSWNGNGDSYNVRYRKQFLSEGFEDGSMPTGWTTEGPGTWSVGTGDYSTTPGSHSGEKNAKIADNERGYVTYLITPSMDLSGETSLTLSFWYINRAFVNDIDDIDGIGVYYRVGTEGTWTELWTTTEAHESWTNQEVTLTGLAANYQLGFKMTDNYGYGVGLDDIQIISADWQTVNDITTKSTTLTGLAANTTYGCQVQSVKAGKTSLWSPIATFTTAANAVVLTEDDGVTELVKLAGKTVNVSFTRAFTKDVASTICLPFGFTPSTTEQGTFYKFNGVDDSWQVHMTNTVTEIEANKPYMFTPAKTGDITFTGTIANVAASYTPTADTQTTNWSFEGTYEFIQWDGESDFTGWTAIYAFVANPINDGSSMTPGEFRRLYANGSTTRPFRAVMKYNGTLPAARGVRSSATIPTTLKVVIDNADGSTTEIGTIDTRTGEMTINEWHTLDGRKLSAKPTKKGMYIKDGKTVVIK